MLSRLNYCLFRNYQSGHLSLALSTYRNSNINNGGGGLNSNAVKNGTRMCDTASSCRSMLSSAHDSNNNNGRENQKRGALLTSIKEQGLSSLESSSSTIQSKTKRRLLLSEEDTGGPSTVQLREAQRLKEFLQDAIEQYTSSKQQSTFCIGAGNDPIVIVDVEITPDLRQARAFWSLPYSILLMETNDSASNRRNRDRAVQHMQQILDTRGKVLQGMVHHRMRRYRRPPMIRFVPAENEMLRATMVEMMP